MKMIDGIHERGGVVTGFTSVCGGLPSPEAANNPLMYKFSWSPMGVLSACQNDAVYRLDNNTIKVRILIHLVLATQSASDKHVIAVI